MNKRTGGFVKINTAFLLDEVIERDLMRKFLIHCLCETVPDNKKAMDNNM